MNCIPKYAVVYVSKEVILSLAKPPLNFSDCLAKFGSISLVKETTGV